MVFTKSSLLALTATAVAVSTASALPRVDPGLHRTLRQQGAANLIITMKADTKSHIAAVQETKYTSREAKIEALYERLNSHAKDSQAELDALFTQEARASNPLFTKTQAFWISNQRYVENASVELVEKLAKLSTISEIREQFVLPVPHVTAGEANSTQPLANEWGVAKINAPQVWAGGNTGKGIIVSTIDTGVRGTHEILKNNHRAEKGWFDPEKKAADPYDTQGHGSHTMGTIAGANGVGVAPGAQWIACKGCRTDGCSEADLLTCAEFITCPTDADGNNKDCSKAPHLVSNSWGGGQGDTFYKAAVDAWRAAGIIPIFANGNEGPACTTASSPGDYDTVIAVGATDNTDKLASFSSKGPSKGGLLKPEVSAPGVNVRSSWFDSDTGYNTISGTSMATPHVAGVVALLLAAQPGLTYDQVKAAVTTGVVTSGLGASGSTCGGTPDSKWPNNQYGYGRIDAVKVVGVAPTPTSSTPAPTTKTPAPTTKTPAPTTKTPAPTTKTPAPTTKTPAPTTRTPKPTTPAPSTCADLGFVDCYYAEDCYWDWNEGYCVPF